MPIFGVLFGHITYLTDLFQVKKISVRYHMLHGCLPVKMAWSYSCSYPGRTVLPIVHYPYYSMLDYSEYTFHNYGTPFRKIALSSY